MKYVVILGDGMADYPVEQLNGKTPLQAAHKPFMDSLARKGLVGLVKTVPDGISPGSDVANLSVLGYNPLSVYTGRSPLEAVSMGIDMKSTDVAVRCNLVTLSGEENYEDKYMLDYSSDEISTEEASVLINAVEERLGNNIFKFYPGISYRHCLIWQNGELNQNLIPPHDISKKKIKGYLPGNDKLRQLMIKSRDILNNHPVNQKRMERGLNPANSIWLWGEGTRPAISKFYDLYHVKGSVISAVDLIKGIAVLAGLNSVNVKGATGNIHTDFTAKKDAALSELKNGMEFVYIHIEAPDECGHRFEVENKVKSIELIDEKVVGPLIEGLEALGEEYGILVLPDHPTPLSLGTHTSDPVPFILYTSGRERNSGVSGYDEEQAKSTQLYIHEGHTLMEKFLKQIDITKEV